MLTRAGFARTLAAGLALAALALGTPALAATCTATASGNWGTAGIWNCGNVPQQGDSVVIPSGVTVTLNVNTNRVNDLNVQAGGTLVGDNTNKTLTMDNGTGVDITNNGTIDFGPGKLATVFLRQASTWAGAGSWTLSTLNLNGRQLNFSGGTTATITMSGAAAPITNPGTVISLTTVTWNFAGTVAQTLPASTGVQYGNITVSNTAGTTLGVDLIQTNNNIIGNLTVASGGILNNGGFAITLASGKSLSVQAAGTLNLTGTSTMVTVSGGGTKTFAPTSTVNYGGANQAVTAETYGNLSLTGSGTKTIASGTTTIAGSLTLASGVTYGGANNPTVNLAGDLSDSGTFNSGTGTFTFNGTSAQNLTGTSANTTFTNMRMNNATGLTLNHNATVATLLTLSSGVISTGTNTLVTSANCTAPSISRTSGHIAGNLQLQFPTGAPSCTFYVGDTAAANFTPVAVSFTNVSAAGGLIGSTTGADFGDANLPVDPALDVTRYWTLNTPGSGAMTMAGSSSYAASMTYLSSDDDAGATPSAYLVGRGDTCGASSCTTWTFPTLSGTPTSTAASASGMATLNTVLVVGEHRILGFRVDNPASPAGTPIPDQTQNTAFNIRITAVDPQGNTVAQFTGTVDVSPSAGCTVSAGGGTTGAFTAGQLASYSVTVSTTGTCSITVKKTTDATRTGTSNTFNVGASVASFNAVQPGAAAASTAIFTKISGTDFAVDILALNSGNTIATGFTGAVIVEVVDNTSAGACASLPVIATFTNQTFASADAGRHALTSGNNVSLAFRNAKIRIKYPTASPTITSCSVDNFAIRPSSLVVSVTHGNRTTAVVNPATDPALNNKAIANGDASGNKVHNAGQPFRIVATAARADATTVTNYDPTSYGGPTAQTVACSAGAACTGSFGILNLGTWSASSGVVTTTTANYSDVGAFSLQLQDASFASVDSGDAGIGTAYIIPASAAPDVGRFVPDHFAVSAASITPRSDLGACSASTFTYMDEPMVAGLTLTAQNASSATTSLYAGSLARLALTDPTAYGFGAIDGGGPTPLSSRIDTSLIATVAGMSWTGGVTKTGASTGLQLPIAIARGASPDGPYNALRIGIAPGDLDGVALASGALNLDADNNSVNERASLGGATGARFGRINIVGNSGASNVSLPIRVRAEYWNGSVFIPNDQDNCTPLTRAQVGMTFNGLVSCATPFTTGSITFSAGAASWVLTGPGASSSGAVDLRVNLSAATGTACTPGASAAGTAAMSYLQYRWTNPAGTLTDDPIARATFGTYGQDRLPNNVIFRRENF